MVRSPASAGRGEGDAGSGPSLLGMRTPPDDDTWLGLTESPLPVGAAADWAVLPNCGAVVLFSGTARDHAPGREGVERLEYEAYEEQVVPRLRAIVDEMRQRWPDLGRVALLHRQGTQVFERRQAGWVQGSRLTPRLDRSGRVLHPLGAQGRQLLP